MKNIKQLKFDYTTSSKNINYLTKDDIPLLTHMEENVKEYILKNYGKEKSDSLMYFNFI